MELPIALAQIRPVKADAAATLDRIEEVLAGLDDLRPRPRVVVFPESALTGYFLEGGVSDHALDRRELFAALQERYGRAGGARRPLDVAVGFYERAADGVFNSAMYARLGEEDPGIVHVHRKVFLPTYGVFQEERFVEAGARFTAFDTAWGRTALLVCEDAWHSLASTLAALDGARVLFVLSASPALGARPGSGLPDNLDRWRRQVRTVAEEHGVFVCVSQLVGFEGAKGFAGGSLVCGPRGEIRAEAPLWEESLLPVTLPLDEIVAARTASPLLADLRAALPRILEAGPAPPFDGRRAESTGTDRGATEAESADRIGAGPEGDPDPDDLSPLAIDTDLVERWLVRFLREELEDRGFRRAVLGLSGGVDSAVVAALAVRALGPDAVTGLLLPSEITSAESEELAREVAGWLGIETRRIEITGAVDSYLEEHEPDAGHRRRGNVMARQRMIVLFDQGEKLGALPVGAGNKSERLLGYFTWHGDDAPPVNPLGDLFKTQVWELARAVGVPEEVVERPPTAELEPDQTDEEELGLPYREADLILHHLLEGRSPGRLVECGFEAEKVDRVRELLESSHFKRNPATVAMISRTAIGEWFLRPSDYRPREGRRG